MPAAPSQSLAIIPRNIGGLVFDAVFKEAHESELEVSDNPIESGASVSDHAYMKPLRCTISAGVSDVRLNPSASDPYSGTSRSRAAYEMLSELQAKAEPFTVQTGLKLYSNMVCTSMSTEQDKDSSSAFKFTAVLREVIIVSTGAVRYEPKKAGATHRQASAKQARGEKQGKAVPKAGTTAGTNKEKLNQAQGKLQSILSRIF